VSECDDDNEEGKINKNWILEISILFEVHLIKSFQNIRSFQETINSLPLWLNPPFFSLFSLLKF
jgi:hypothetical protein